MRKSRRIVFSSSWSRVRQAKELDNWQQSAYYKMTNYGQINATVIVYK